MGRLHPYNFSLREVDAFEQRVIESLIEYTDDEWLIMPKVMIGGDRTYEIDVVCAHPSFGFCILEVKGWNSPRIENGKWIGPDGSERSDPVDQLRTNQFKLRKILREIDQSVKVEAAIVFTEVNGIPGDTTPLEVTQEQLIWSSDLETVDSSLIRLCASGRQGKLMFDEGVFAELVKHVRRTVEFEPDSFATRRYAFEKLTDRTVEQLRTLERLDINRRVYVSGGAGSGKSRLAASWARRALGRGERVLLVCYNDPLGEEFQQKFADSDGIVLTGPFLRLAQELEGMPPCVQREGESDQDFWDKTVQGHLHLHWHKVTETFDTIIVDESQDFSPSWLAMLMALLDPSGARKVLMVGDVGQELHKRRFEPPKVEDGWTIAELGPNVRNTLDIARLLRNRLGGPPAPSWLPSTTHLGYREIDDLEGVAQTARSAVNDLVGHGFKNDDIAVITLSSAIRDAIVDGELFVRFDDRSPTTICCENAHRMKGLEFSAVVIVGLSEQVNDEVLYVAISRAVHGLVICCPQQLADRLRITQLKDEVEGQPA